MTQDLPANKNTGVRHDLPWSSRSPPEAKGKRPDLSLAKFEFFTIQAQNQVYKIQYKMKEKRTIKKQCRIAGNGGGGGVELPGRKILLEEVD